MATLRQLTLEVQRQYPRIYLACHIDHAARRGQAYASVMMPSST
jgi:hypothetical protein